MGAINGRAIEYGLAFRDHKELTERVRSLRVQLLDEEELLRKAEMKMSQAKRTLLEEAQRS